MWNTESSKHFIKKIMKEYRREIIQEGSISVLGLTDHFDEMVAKAMNIDKDFIILARQWRIALERAAFTEGINKVKLVLEREQEVGIIQQEIANGIIKEVEMRIEVPPTVEIRSVTEVEAPKNVEQTV